MWSYGDIVSIQHVAHAPFVSCLYQGKEYRCPQLLGIHNGANVLVALMLAHDAGVSLESMHNSLQKFQGIPGRLNWYKLPNGAYACIDYAHNPSSFEATLSSLRACTEHFIVIFGAGGERDAARRPVMGAIEARFIASSRSSSSMTLYRIDSAIPSIIFSHII